MRLLFPIISYLSYYLKAVNEHSLHSPFIYDFYTNIVKPHKMYYAFDKIESYRKHYLQQQEIVHLNELGAGSHHNSSLNRSIGDIARHSLSSSKLSQLLFKIIHHFQFQTVIELGTSLGINSLYMEAANPAGKVFTFEGSNSMVEKSRELFEQANISNIQIIQGNIDEQLPLFLNKIVELDLVYFDANHRYEPTLKYFEWCSPKAHSQSVFIIGDIHWSKEMRLAWKDIQLHPNVMLTLDLYEAGLVFFKNQPQKQHFVLEF